MSQKTQFEADLEALTPDQLKQADDIMQRVKSGRGAGNDEAFRKKVSNMSDAEFQKMRDDL